MMGTVAMRIVRRGLSVGFAAWALVGCGTGSESLAEEDADAAYSYREPSALDDGWSAATPEELGLAREPLEAMTAAIQRGDYHNVHAVLIAKDGRLVYEEYFTGTDRRPETGAYSETVTWTFDENTLHTTRSAGKSFTGALVGVALADGALQSVEQAALEFFPEYETRAAPGVDELTVSDLLSMTAGQRWDQHTLPYSDPRNPETAMNASPDPADYLLSIPLASPPGSSWVYSSGATTLLGLILHRATGDSYADYLRERLFDPLQIKRFDWTGPATWADHPAFAWEGAETWPMERASSPAGSLWLLPRDMLKFGQLIANGGTWRGVRVLGEGWVAESLAPLVPRSERPIEYPNGVVREASYGYQWWHDRLELPYGEVVIHSASGNGGQKIWVLPDFGLAVVHLAGNYNVTGSGWEAERLLLERVVPWAIGQSTDYRHQPALEPVDVNPREWPLPALDEADLLRYAGTYELGGDRVLVRSLDGHLQLLPPIGMGPIDLIPTGPHTFVHGVVHGGVVTKLYFPDERLVFVMDEVGLPTGLEVVGESGVIETGTIVGR